MKKYETVVCNCGTPLNGRCRKLYPYSPGGPVNVICPNCGSISTLSPIPDDKRK